MANTKPSAVQVTYAPAGTGAVISDVQSKLRETISVKDFGAVGDGVADDTAAIQAAINQGDGKTLFFPEGIYLVSDDVIISNKKIRIVGAGIRNTIILRNGNYVSLRVREGDSANLTSDFGISDLQLLNIRINFFNNVSFAIIDNISSVRTAAASYDYYGVDANAAITGTTTLLENIQIKNSRFVGMRGAIRLEATGVEYNNVFIFNNVCLNNAHVGIVVGVPVSTATQDKCIIAYNVVQNIGDPSGIPAPTAYVVGIRAAGDDIMICNNIVRNVVTSAYWESDGIYTKQKKAVISDNILDNAGYRSAITTKQLDPNGAYIASSVLIRNNQIHFDAVNTGYSGNPGNVFSGVTNLYGGINIVSYNTIVSDNHIVGSGCGIYNVNSTNPWLNDNITITGNNIVGNRGKFGMYIIGAGENWTITNNSVRDFNPQFTTDVFGIALQIPAASYWFTSGVWVASEPTYQNKQIINAYVANNYVDLQLNSAGGGYAINMEARDAWAGGAMPTFPSSFEKCAVVNNMAYASNAGAGSAYAYLFQQEAARFVNCHFDTKYLTSKTGVALPSGYGISGYRTNAGNPNGGLTPLWVGDWVLDTTNSVWYKSRNTTNTSWTALN